MLSADYYRYRQRSDLHVGDDVVDEEKGTVTDRPGVTVYQLVSPYA